MTREVDVDRGGRAVPARRRAVHAARAPGDVRDAHPGAAAPAPSRGRAARRRVRRDLHAASAPRGSTRPWKLPEPISVELTALRTRLLPSLVEAAQRNVDAGSRGDHTLRDRARLPARRQAARGATARRGHREGGFVTREGRRRDALRGAQRGAALRARRGSTASSGQDDPSLRPDCRGAPARAPRGRVGRVRARSRDLVEWCTRAGDLRGRDHVSAAAPGPRLRSARRGGRGRSGRGGARGGGPRAPTRCGSSTSIAATRSAEDRKSVAFALSFQSPERTLSDEDAAELRKKIVDALAKRFGAELRA